MLSHGPLGGGPGHRTRPAPRRDRVLPANARDRRTARAERGAARRQPSTCAGCSRQPAPAGHRRRRSPDCSSGPATASGLSASRCGRTRSPPSDALRNELLGRSRRLTRALWATFATRRRCSSPSVSASRSGSSAPIPGAIERAAAGLFGSWASGSDRSTLSAAIEAGLPRRGRPPAPDEEPSDAGTADLVRSRALAALRGFDQPEISTRRFVLGSSHSRGRASHVTAWPVRRERACELLGIDGYALVDPAARAAGGPFRARRSPRSACAGSSTASKSLRSRR